MKTYRISPSKLSYDLGGCHRCFAEALNGERWPTRSFPGLFSRLDRHQRDYYDGKPTSAIDPSLPPGIIRNAKGVMSATFTHNGVALTIKGILDAVAELDDGGLIVIDFKSSIPNNYLADRYRAQLSAYQWALTKPLRTEPRDVTGLGLLVVCPESMADTEAGVASLLSTTWIPVSYDQGFADLLRHICNIAANPFAAPSDINCDWCGLRDRLKV
jgi:hypothetical protein